MSWLRQNFPQSITGGITQLKGQLEDILTESTEDIIDPQSELQVSNEKLKESDRQIELLKSELSRLHEGSSELSIKCKTFEAQLEQKSIEFKNAIAEKNAQIEYLKKSPPQPTVEFSDPNYQKSALMEDFEELIPQNEFSDYIHLEKEIKRLTDDNQHLLTENKLLSNRVKSLETKKESSDENPLEEQTIHRQTELETTIDELTEKIFNLEARLAAEKDKHQQDIISIQESYTQRTNAQLNEILSENNELKEELSEIKTKLASQLLEEQLSMKVESNKSDDGWCINEDDINLDGESNAEKKATTDENNKELNELKSQIMKLENELEIAKKQILDLEIENNASNEVSEENKGLKTKLAELAKQTSQEDNIESLKSLNENSRAELKKSEDKCDLLMFQIKQLQDNVNQERLLQMADQKSEKIEIDRLLNENEDLKQSIDQKLNEIDSLGKQIIELNSNLYEMKENSQNISNEFETKTNELAAQLEKSNLEISALKNEKSEANEQKKQFEFVLDEKSREIAQLKLDIKTHLQHIESQSKAIEKQQSDLKQESETTKTEDAAKIDELMFFKNQYNEIYGYLEEKNVESLNYYNEIQRLNIALSELNRELVDSKNKNTELNQQCENLEKEFQLQQQMVENLNQQTSELTESLCETKESVKAHLEQTDNKQLTQEPDILKNDSSIDAAINESPKIEVSNEAYDNLTQQAEANQRIIGELKLQIDELYKEREMAKKQTADQVNDLNTKLDKTIEFYEEKLIEKTEGLKAMNDDENQQTQRLKKELLRLKEHLVEMSDNYNNDAIQAEERERQLRLALNDAQQNIQQNDQNLENSSKEIEEKMEKLNIYNQKLKKEKEKLEEQLKKSETNLTHQTKVTQNLELVLERLQSDADSQNTMEIKTYKKTIKDQASQIYTLQREVKSHQLELENANEALNEIQMLDMELKQKDDIIKQLKAQIGTKDSLIESFEKRITETKKMTNDFIEKEIVKSLVIGYIKVNKANEKKQVLKLISTMLNFTPTETEQVEAANEPSSWFGLYKTNTPHKSPANTLIAPDGSLNQSFTDLFIQYVDRESKPKPNFTFDISDPSVSHKKTDGSPSGEKHDLRGSASAVKFLSTAGGVNNAELNLVNQRNSSSGQLAEPSNNIQSLASPAVANNFMEQILK